MRENSARQKAAEVRRAQVAVRRRRRRFVIGAAVLAMVAAAAGIGVLVQHGRADRDAALGTGPFVAPAGAVGEGGLAIPYGASRNAKVSLAIYEDFRCPYCRMAEATFESAYRPYAQAGKITVQYHLVDLIDRNLGGTGSIRAGNAGACAQDAGKFEAYHDLLYASQPEESDDAYGSNAALFSLADRVPGLNTTAFQACVNRGTHGSWVKRDYDTLSKLLNGSVATPYYAIDGAQYKITGRSAADEQAAFKAALDCAISAAR